MNGHITAGVQDPADSKSDPSDFEVDQWKSWDEVRPMGSGFYRWRIPAQDYGGLILRPEWTSQLSKRSGRGDDPKMWPEFSIWDGSSRYVPCETEWRAIQRNEPKESWPGLMLKNCPFCGSIAKLTWDGVHVNAPVFYWDSFKIQCSSCRLAGSSHTRDLKYLVEQWNTRKESA